MSDYIVIERTQTLAATPQRIAPHLVDFRNWVAWSPWEELDPDLQRTYTGPERGVGAGYAWDGNKKAGAGNMLVTAASDAAIDIDVNFTKPFKSASKTHFDLRSVGDTTTVVWQMRTPKTVMTRIFGIFVNFEKNIGADLEKGLGKLKQVVESQ